MDDHDSVEKRLDVLATEADRLRSELTPLLPRLAEARRKYFLTKSQDSSDKLDQIQAQVESLHDRCIAIADEMQRISGIPDEVFEALEIAEIGGDDEPRRKRRDLTIDKVATTSDIDVWLPSALEKFHSLVGADWLSAGRDMQCRLDEIGSEKPLSLVRGVRSESEFPQCHRFLQSLLVAQDYVLGHPNYDHFGGAMIAPQLAQLGRRLDLLGEIGGDVEERLKALWNGPSASSDSTAFELLVAGACAEKGRRLEFLRTRKGQGKSPDLRCHDPFPLLIECKRKRSLSEYEIQEEENMRRIFDTLCRRASNMGLWGIFDLTLSVEWEQFSVDEIVSKLISQRLAAHPDRFLTYEWGAVAYSELQRRVRLPNATRTYSPNMLSNVFNWDTDLPEWDGIVCKVSVDGEAVVREVGSPLALRWVNHSEHAIRKRSRGPVDLFGAATNQIPEGEFAIIYVAYQEGTRPDVADMRLENIEARLREWEHSAAIRIPISFLNRLYPRPLADGRPDLIESTIRLSSDAYGNPQLFGDFPSLVFSHRENGET